MARGWIAVVALLGLLLLAGTAPAQEQADQSETVGGLAFRDEFELTVVNLVVYVTDAKGRAVTDLGADDFEVFQDGQLKPITNFQLYTEEVVRRQLELPLPVGATAEPEAPAAPEVGPRPVWLVLYLDHFNLSPIDRNRVLNQVRSFVTDNVKPPVKMMVVSRQQSAKVLLDFTSESRAVHDVLRGVRTETGGRPSVERDRNALIQTMQSYEYNPSNLNSPVYVKSLIRNFAREEANNLQFTLGSLREVISMLSGLEGKKAVIYVSNGLPMVPGIDLFNAYAAAYGDSSALPESLEFDQSRAFESLVAAANAQDVAVYSIDAGGLRAAGVATAEYTDSQDRRSAAIGYQNYLDSLRLLADGTGGIAIVDTNDVGPWLERVEEDFYTYYSIGYSLQQSGADKVHDVKVRLPNHPGYQLRYRRRFAEKSLETRVQEKVVTGLMLPLEENPMGLTLELGQPNPATTDRWITPVKVGLPAGSIALVPEGEDLVGRVILFVAARDTEGRQSDVVQQEHELRVPAAEAEAALERRFTIDVSLLMKAGSHAVAVGVLDRVTHQSSYQRGRVRVGPGA